MALADRNIIITPNIGAASEPNVLFRGADASSSATVYLRVYNSGTVGTLSFEGNSGQLLSITDSMVGTIFSVNDISGIPSIEVLDTGEIRLAQYSGNVGIGKSSPNYRLDVLDSIGLTGSGPHSRPALTSSYWGYSSSYRALLIGSTSTTYNTAITGAVSVAFNYDPSINSNSSFNGDGREIIFRRGTRFVTPNSANNAWNLQNLVLYDGNVGIGTDTPSFKLHVAGDTYVTGSLGVGTTASGTTGEIRASHEITAYYSSDIRLKENIRLIEDPITIVNQIRGVKFDWTDEHMARRGGEDGYFVRKHDVGVIAQEIEAVLPELVATREDGFKAVKYEKLVALLIEAVKTQQQQITQIQEQLNKLNSKY